jgi:hypothetical protein
MGYDSKQFLRDGSTNLTSTETNPAASGASKGAITLMTGLPLKGMWLKAWFKGTFTGTSAVNTVHATSSPSSGTYTLTLGNKTATAIAYTATPSTVAAALAALATQSSPLVINGKSYTSLVAATDIVGSGAAYSAGDLIITFGGVLKYQPIVLVLDASGTNAGTPVLQSTTAGSQIKIQATDGTNIFDDACYLDGAVAPFQEVAVHVDPSVYRLYGGQPLTSLNYKATVAGTITAAPVVIVLDETMGRKG